MNSYVVRNKWNEWIFPAGTIGLLCFPYDKDVVLYALYGLFFFALFNLNVCLQSLLLYINLYLGYRVTVYLNMY